MTRDAYLKSPEAVDMVSAERAIRRGSLIAFFATVGAFTGAYFFLPALMSLPTALPERLGFAALCWAIPGFVLLVAVMMVSAARRHSPADIGGQAAGPPSPKLAIKAAFLQNTLEQTVLAGGFYLALAAVADGAWLGLIVVAVTLFVVGRVLFYTGYHRGAQGRSLGMALTLMPSALGYPIVGAVALFG